MRFHDRAVDAIERYGLIKVFLFIFVFLQPISRGTSIKESAFVIMLVLFCVKSVKRGLSIEYRDRIIQGLILLTAVCVISSVLSPYPLDSFNFLRKGLFYQLAVFLVVINEFDGMEALRPLVYALLSGFAVLSLAIVFTRPPGVLLNWLYATTHGDDKLLQGYSLFATFYIPLALAYLYASRNGAAVKAVFIAIISMEFVLSILNNHRGQIIAIVVSMAVITVLAKRYKALVAWLVLTAVISAALLFIKPDSFDRYKTIVMPDSYVTKTVRASGSVEYEGLTDRLSIWKGTLDMIKDRPLIGYGYGWKKIAYAVRDGGWLDRWDKESRTYGYFSERGYGSASPHNLTLQILFEVGIIGFAAFLFFWGAVVWRALARAGKDSGEGARLLVYSVVGVLVSYALINLVNGLWEEVHGILMMAFAGMVFVLQRESTGNRFRGRV
ncbi:MAG: O-antigen ligase family protein [Deltaproteobacteria bacterium]|nr:O-antigen ligase family protein [Deltaproteobacteria bacterium]